MVHASSSATHHQAYPAIAADRLRRLDVCPPTPSFEAMPGVFDRALNSSRETTGRRKPPPHDDWLLTCLAHADRLWLCPR